MKAVILFPHQLFTSCLDLEGHDHIALVEDHLYFTNFRFHKQKLILHRASMKYFADYLEKNDKTVHYFSFQDFKDHNGIISALKENGIEQLTGYALADFLLNKRLNKVCEEHNIELQLLDTPGFITPLDELKKMMEKKKSGYFMANFYQKQRKRLNLLMDGDEPEGGKWSFDDENRKKLPKDHTPPSPEFPGENKFVKGAREYVSEKFEDNYGELDDFIYPVTHEDAANVLDDFLINRMNNFGPYEDAISEEHPFIYHSMLSAPLNIGLLTPQQIVDRTMELHEEHDFPLNSLEGFLRQIVGWREFMRGVYEFAGVFERTNNHWEHDRKMPESFWTGDTGITPIDHTIKKANKYAYAHHIERLMIMGNFSLLCGFDPDDIYRWFMELFIDAYDWVMVPNVYGMTQYADGGLITTKPYISGSNYLKKMSRFKNGDWNDVWDGLYWRFIHLHQEEFAKNQRMSMMASMVDRMNKDKLNKHLENAEDFLNSLD